MGMHSSTIAHQYSPATRLELGVVKVGTGLIIDSSGTLSVGFTITATAGDNGSISPAGISTIEPGGSLSYTITPDSNYIINDVLIDGVSVGAVSSYTFTNVSENHTISVSFKYYFVIFENGIFNCEYTTSGNGTLTISGNNAIITCPTPPDFQVRSLYFNNVTAKTFKMTCSNVGTNRYLHVYNSDSTIDLSTNLTTTSISLDISSIEENTTIKFLIGTSSASVTVSKIWIEE